MLACYWLSAIDAAVVVTEDVVAEICRVAGIELEGETSTACIAIPRCTIPRFETWARIDDWEDEGTLH
jgi:hypothetical protein